MPARPLRPLRRPLAVLAAALALLATPAAALDTAARAALMIDATTGARLLDKNADQRIPPASMSKLMTIELVFEALEEGRLSLDDRFRVSRRAYDMGGSTMFLREGDRVRVEDLLRGVVVQSGNDASVVLAEGLAGSEEAFAERMTERATELGLTRSNFTNSTGWPHPEEQMSAGDLVRLAEHIIEAYPDRYAMFAEREFEWEGVSQRNRNPLVHYEIAPGVVGDGLKTGHTQEAGYGLVGSATDGTRRVIFMIGGLEDARARSAEAERLVSWAFRHFEVRTLYEAGEIIGAAEVWLGADALVPLTVAEDVVATVPVGELENTRATVVFDGPLPAPIAAGQRIGTLRIETPEVGPMEVPVVAAEAVAEGGALVRLQAAAGLLIADLAARVAGRGAAGGGDAGGTAVE